MERNPESTKSACTRPCRRNASPLSTRHSLPAHRHVIACISLSTLKHCAHALDGNTLSQMRSVWGQTHRNHDRSGHACSPPPLLQHSTRCPPSRAQLSSATSPADERPSASMGLRSAGCARAPAPRHRRHACTRPCSAPAFPAQLQSSWRVRISGI